MPVKELLHTKRQQMYAIFDSVVKVADESILAVDHTQIGQLADYQHYGDLHDHFEVRTLLFFAECVE